MAKTYKRRRFTRKGRWSANIQELNSQEISAESGNWAGTTTLATNPAQSTLGVSQTYTLKNMEINFTIDGHIDQSTAWIEAVTVYIMYVPQGMNVSENYNLDHPEYILTYKYLGSPFIENTPSTTVQTTQNYQPFKVKTRMARRLQTGDSIVLFIKGYNSNSDTVSLNLSGVIRWWTKAN